MNPPMTGRSAAGAVKPNELGLSNSGTSDFLAVTIVPSSARSFTPLSVVPMTV